MNSNDPIEVSAATVDAAINDALRQLGADHDDVIIEVLSTPRAGVLGLLARQARVRVSRRPELAAHSEAQSPPPAPPLGQTPPRPRQMSRPEPQPRRRDDRRTGREKAPAANGEESRGHLGETSDAPRTATRAEAPAAPRPRPERHDDPAAPGARIEDRQDEHGEPSAAPRSAAEREEQVREARALLARTLELMGEQAEVREISDDDPGTIALEIKGDGSGVLIGRHGQTLDALEYVLGRMLARKVKEPASLLLETESYRARRRQQLHRMALQMGERAKREHAAVRLEPMVPRDRRVIHIALKEDPLVSTRSTGTGFLRAVEIAPVGGGGGRRDRERRSERSADAPVGQQGGFKHGQKKII